MLSVFSPTHHHSQELIPLRPDEKVCHGLNAYLELCAKLCFFFFMASMGTLGSSHYLKLKLLEGNSKNSDLIRSIQGAWLYSWSAGDSSSFSRSIKQHFWVWDPGISMSVILPIGNLMHSPRVGTTGLCNSHCDERQVSTSLGQITPYLQISE